MKKRNLYVAIALLFLTLSAFTVHKFYMGIYQINYAPEKKMLQVTSRIFLDDLNKTLEKKYARKSFHLGSSQETPEELELLKKYLADNLYLKVNGQTKQLTFLSKEVDDDVLVCYSSVKGISKISTLEIFNSVLMDWSLEQQNITHITVLGTKNSILFTESSRSGMLKY
ncbi:DUF6702 family protein [Flavobacterium muglaense]|uniref:Peptidase E n=1 Tax=Flavobacterium muglaense TaxID=2764716 RepID=A0A923SI03_9FLAO|nr:DUF6702 family protein [Flavobacterium muglaense]MBC5839704.1 hypothetical protein [Flavobacterium muglaense]MBC5846224.1 hypothetical protein [Flavobacterium muglaense]